MGPESTARTAHRGRRCQGSRRALGLLISVLLHTALVFLHWPSVCYTSTVADHTPTAIGCISAAIADPQTATNIGHTSTAIGHAIGCALTAVAYPCHGR